MKTSKFPLISGIIILTIAVILTLFPTFAMNQIKLNIINGNANVPAYKLTESLQFWEIANLTILQPMSILLYIVSAILLIYGITRTFTLQSNPKLSS